MKKICISILLAVVLMIPQVALAGDKSGFYVSGTLGMGSGNTIDLDDSETVTEPDANFETNIYDLSNIEFGSDGNFNGLIAIGKNIGKSYRLELEYGFRSSDVSHFRADSSSYQVRDANAWTEGEYGRYLESDYNDGTYTEAEVKSAMNDAVNETNKQVMGNPEEDIFDERDTAEFMGDLDIHSLMVNLYKDFNHGSKFRPYVGAGIGVAWADYEILGPDGDVEMRKGKAPEWDEDEERFEVETQSKGEDFDARNFLDDTASAFGYQFMAGVGYEATPEVILTAGYRLFGTEGEFDTTIHAAEFGVRYNF